MQWKEKREKQMKERKPTHEKSKGNEHMKEDTSLHWNRAVDFVAENIQLVLLDVDGTLCSFQTHAAMPKALEAVTILRRKGIKVALATGRSEQAILDLREGEFDAFICSSGQNCFLPSGETLRKVTIPREDLESLIRFLQWRERQNRTPYDVVFIAEDHAWSNHLSESTIANHKGLNFILYPVKPYEELLQEDYLQLMFFGDEKGEREIMDHMPNSQSTRWHPNFIDIMPKAGGKGDGLLSVCKHFDIKPSNCICFGDGENDVAMFKEAGISIAMGNATEKAKQAADAITANVDDEGIYWALLELGLLS